MPYAPGALRAEGDRGGRSVADATLTTSGEPATVRLTADRKSIRSDGQDLSFVTVEALDAAGRLQPNAGEQVEFAIRGPGVIAAVGTGDTKSPEPYQANRRSLFNGRALVIIRSSGNSGPITLTAKANGLGETNITINAATEQSAL